MYPTYFLLILKELYSADGWIDLYRLHESARLSPAQISEAIAALQIRKLVVTDSELTLVRLTPDGYRWVDSNSYELFMEPRAHKTWRATPQQPLTNDYVPSPKELEVEFLTTLADLRI